MSPEERAELRALAEAATAGPWEAQVLGSEGYAVRAEPIPVGKGSMTRRPRVARCGHEDWDTDKANAAFIAAARTAVPALLDALDERDCGAAGCRAIADRDAEEARADRAEDELARLRED